MKPSLLIFALGWMVLLGAAQPSAAREIPDQSPLPGLLDRLDRVADLYLDEALSFTCDEAVTYFTRHDRRTDRFEYLYAYDEARGLEDRRTPVGKRGPAAADSSGEVSMSGLRRAYNWVFIFQASRRDYYRFEIVGRKKTAGRPAVGIRFEPIPPILPGRNDLDGVAWIDEETSQLLHVEAETVGESRERLVTEFRVEKNGMRFPSKVILFVDQGATPSPTWYDPASSPPVLRVEQVYTNYRFFGVRTSEEIRRFVHDGETNE